MTGPRSSPPLKTIATTIALLALVAYVAWSERRTAVDGPAPRPAATTPSTGAAARAEVVQAPAEAPTRPTTDPAPAPVARGSGLIMHDQQIHDERGRLVYEGDIDLGPVFARLAAGQRDVHRNDGTVFANREGRLPKAPRGHYTEWVVRTEGVRSVGPQRLITGQKGEAFYTPDHYETFIRVRGPS